MGQTIVGVGDAKAIKKFSVVLAQEFSRESYWTNRFLGMGEEAETPVQIITDLEKDQGDQVSYDLCMNLKQQPVEGDDTLKGKEEGLQFYSDNMYIDQMRAGVNCGGKMTRKRTIHNLRKIGLSRGKDWWARIFDELLFIYASGARGVNDDYILPTSYTGFSGNAISAPDTSHQFYGNNATSKISVDSADIMDLTLIERLQTYANTIGGGVSGVPAMVPCKIEGEARFVLVMHEYQAYSLRTASGTGQWLDIQKAAAGAIGNSSPMFKGGLGMYSDTILHKHRAVVRFSDYGAGANLPAARALFMGRQAVVCGWGSPGTGMRMNWGEEMDDRGNQLILFAASIYGIKKTTFNSLDFGIFAADTYAIAP